MRAALALALATMQSMSRYPAQYVGGAISPVLWVLPTWMMVVHARALGLEQSFAEATGLSSEMALLYLFLGALYWNYVEGVWGVALYIRQSMVNGTLEALWATPASRLSLVIGWSLGRLLGITLHSAVAFSLLLALGWRLPRLPWIPAVAVLVLSVLAAYGFAFLLAGLSLRFRDDGAAVTLLGNAAPLLGGVIFPVLLLPQPLRLLSYLFPFTYGADALRGILLGSRTLLPLPTELALVAAMGLLLPLGGWAVFSRLEALARRQGLDGF
ncbi:MAG: ABC transporter permease [Bacillota bacterium]